MTHEELGHLANDSRLTADALRLVLAVLSSGPGEHEFDSEYLRTLLNCRDLQVVYRARQRAVDAGYLGWRQGGRGHGNFYEYLPFRAEIAEPDTSGQLPIVKHQDNPDTSCQLPTGKAPVVEEEGSSTPPIIPLPILTAEAAAAMEKHDALLTGCRDSMRDYLTRNVPLPKQYSHIQSVAGWLKGMGFNWLGIPSAEWAGLLAVAYNELGAVDESGYRWPPGDVRNLKNKLEWLVNDRFRGKRQPARTTTKGRDLAPDQQEYTPTNEYRGLNG